MAEIIQQRGLIDKRFEPPPVETFSKRASFLSILSLALLASASYYCLGQLDNPCTTYQLPGVSMRKFFWQKPLRSCMSGKDAENIFHKVNCLFPGVTYRNEKFEYKKCSDENSQVHWTLNPFRATAIVALFGLLFELYLAACFQRFRFNWTPSTKAVHQFREMLYSFVTATSFFTTIGLTEDPDFRVFFFGLLISAFFLAFALVPALYFGRIKQLPVLLYGFQIFQVFLVVSRGSHVKDSAVTFILVVHCFATAFAWLLRVQRSTPVRSAFFHLMFTFSVLSQYVAIALTGHADPSFPRKIHQVLHPTNNTELLRVMSYYAGLLGFTYTNFLSNSTYQAGRSMLSYMVWSTMYFVLLFQRLLVANPFKLSDAYRGKPIRRLSIQPYSQQHWKYMPKTLAVPSVAGPLFPETVEAFADLRNLLTSGFAFMTWLGHHFPQAVTSTPIHDKLRMEVWEDGRNYYPSKLFCLSPTFPRRGRTLHHAPRPMVDKFQEGTLLAYLCQYGIGTAFLQMAREIDTYPYFELTVVEHDDDEVVPGVDVVLEYPNNPEGGLVLDFRDLEFYDTKPDYEPYGGIAFFKIDGDGLELQWVVTPKTQIKTRPDPMSGTFRRAESMIVSSMYFKTVVGKHLVEIHMTFNLLEVALHNAFDYDLNVAFPRANFNGHPLRLILYIHLFNHILAAELTVCHLVQEGAVFSQIWALTYDSLLNYITIQYNTFKYASDENWEYRKAAMAPLLNRIGDQPSFTCSLQWELEYKKIFDRYAQDMVEAIYPTEEAVGNDAALQEFFQSIKTIFAHVPSRFRDLTTRQGLVRFISDTINHLCIRHEVYGTVGVSGALDPRINCTQLPRDGGPPAVDEWRSLAFVALATAYVEFVRLLQDPDNGGENNDRRLRDIFDDATPVVQDQTPQQLVAAMRAAFEKMQRALRDLQTDWYTGRGQNNQSEGCENYMFFRPMPVDISTGPGY